MSFGSLKMRHQIKVTKAPCLMTVLIYGFVKFKRKNNIFLLQAFL